MPQTIELVDRHPNQIFIVDHIAKPSIRKKALDPWRQQLIELASRPNVYCKLSGMVTEAHWDLWTEQELDPVISKPFLKPLVASARCLGLIGLW